MQKSIVFYYSKKGSNRYLANKISQNLNCDIEEIKPVWDALIPLMLMSLTRLSFGNRKLKHDVSDYDSIILCGPIWVGAVITPLYDFIQKYKGSIRNLYFVTCCGSNDAGKDDKFGYESVFHKMKKVSGDIPLHCAAFPIELVLPESERSNDQAVMDTRFSDENFKGEVQQRLGTFLSQFDT